MRALASYNAIMHLPLNDRYESKEMDYIYDFRRMAFGIEKAVPAATTGSNVAAALSRPLGPAAF